MEILYIITGLIIGGVIVWLFTKSRLSQQNADFNNKLNEQEKSNLEKLNALDKEKSILTEKNNDLQSSHQKVSDEIVHEREKNEQLSTRIARAEVEYKNLQEKLESHKSEMENLQKKFTLEFENVASKILKQNTQEFTAVNQKNMGEILSPLKERLQGFEKKVEDTYQKGLRDQTDLKAELKKLHELNMRLGDEANNLTKALKGDVKKQGNWGEIVLERILERSGLKEGAEFQREVVTTNIEGKLIRPDVIINLPDKKHLIIDSKVSLVAYEKFVNEEDEKIKAKYIKEHLLSLRNHIKELNQKHYQSAEGINTPDFVLLFIPIEASFSSAIQADQDLFVYAWDQKVVIVSPSTLLATLRTVASIWQQDNQTRNALEIAKQGGALFDKFVGFVKDLEKIGDNLNTTQKNYEAAMNKLESGKGNLIRSTKKLQSLGAKANKQLPEKYSNKFDFDEENDEI